MTKNDLDDFANPESWDFDNAELRQPERAGRTVVSVSMSRDEFQLVGEYADQIGMKTSEFLRKAALARVRGTRRGVIYSASAGGGSMILNVSIAPTTEVSGKIIAQESRQEIPPPQGLLALG